MERGLRFGVVTLQNSPWTTLVERWQYLNEFGFDSAWVADHFSNPFFPSEPWLEGWTLLSARQAEMLTCCSNIEDSGHGLWPTRRPQSRSRR